MTQNRSAAVMQQRREPHDSLDDFPTPPWATRALCEWLRGLGAPLEEMTCREPAANRGYMVRALEEYFGRVLASDIHDYGAGFSVEDYLFPGADRAADWTITNPPFRLAEEFICVALEASRGVAVIVRSAFLEGIGRHERLFSIYPPSDILQFTERVPMVRGRYDPDAASATAYSWVVWRASRTGRETRFHWISPCRETLEREGDFPPRDLERAVDPRQKDMF